MADVTAPQFQEDVNNTADWANGDENTTVTMRLGQQADSPAKVIKRVDDLAEVQRGSIDALAAAQREDIYENATPLTIGNFTDGFTYTALNQRGKFGNDFYVFLGGLDGLPHPVPAGTDPTVPPNDELYAKANYNDAASVANANGGSVQDFINGKDIGDPRAYGAVAGQDSTAAIQAAANTGMLTITEHYLTDAININIPTVINFTGNGALEKIPTNWNSYDILRVQDAQDVHIYNPVIIGDRDNHITSPNENNYDGFDGEWGMGISIYDSQRIYVYNPNISKCWGDGIYISEAGGSINDEIHIKGDIIIDKCRRQGISVVKGRNVYIDDSVISNIDGTAPMRAIDVEPNKSEDECTNINIGDITSINNQGALLVVSRGGLLDVNCGDIHSKNSRGEVVGFTYSDVNDNNGAGEETATNDDNAVNVGNVYADKSPGTFISFVRPLQGKMPKITIGDCYVEEMLYDASITDLTLDWNVFNLVADRQYTYREFGNITIGDVTVYKVTGQSSVSLFAGVNRLTVGDNLCLQKNVKIGAYTSNSYANVTRPFSSLTSIDSCMFGVQYAATVLSNSGDAILSGYNVVKTNLVTIRQDTSNATLFSDVSFFAVNIDSKVSNIYDVYVNGVLQTSGITTIPNIFNMRGRTMHITRDEHNKEVRVTYINYDVFNSSSTRVSNPPTGTAQFDPTSGKPVWFNGTVWVDATGTAV